MTNKALLLLILALATTASAEWNEKVLYSFQGHRDGQLPVGSIVFDSAGNLYGATTQRWRNRLSTAGRLRYGFPAHATGEKGRSVD
jgi:hypothetical protein